MNESGGSVARWSARLRSAITVFAILVPFALGAIPASASDGTCLDDVTGRTNICIAIDVKLGTFYNAEPISCSPGSPVTLFLRADLRAVLLDRRDIGLFVATDGGNARTGTCYRDYLPPPLAGRDEYNPGEPLPGPDGGPFYDGELVWDPEDECGDLEGTVHTYYDLAPDSGGITVPCNDSDNDGFLDISSCVSWDILHVKTCLGLEDAIPSTRSECRCEMLTVGNVTVEPAEISVTKIATPDTVVEPGADVLFTFTVNNETNVPVTLTSLDDSAFGDLTLYPETTCSLPQPLAPSGQAGDSYTCSITAFIGGGPGMHYNTVTATAVDEAGTEVSDTATEEVIITDALPAIHVEKTADPALIVEPGGGVLYTVGVTNDSGSSDPVTLTSLLDDVYGDLTDDGNPDISNSTCELVTIPPGVTYECSFEAEVVGVAGDSVTDTVTAVVVDDDDSEAQAADDATVTIVSEPPDTGVGLPVPWAVAGLALAGSIVLAVGTVMVGRSDRSGR